MDIYGSMLFTCLPFALLFACPLLRLGLLVEMNVVSTLKEFICLFPLRLFPVLLLTPLVATAFSITVLVVRFNESETEKKKRKKALPSPLVESPDAFVFHLVSHSCILFLGAVWGKGLYKCV